VVAHALRPGPAARATPSALPAPPGDATRTAEPPVGDARLPEPAAPGAAPAFPASGRGARTSDANPAVAGALRPPPMATGAPPPPSPRHGAGVAEPTAADTRVPEPGVARPAVGAPAPRPPGRRERASEPAVADVQGSDALGSADAHPLRPVPAAGEARPRAFGDDPLAVVLDGRAPAAADAAALAAAAGPARLAAALTGGPDVAGRIARLVAAAHPATLRHLLEHLRPGFAARELVALELLWQALPEPPATAGESGIWRFALAAALGRLPPTGGIAGPMAQALAARATPALPAAALARHALARLEAGRSHAPAAAAQLAAGLRRLAGGDGRGEGEAPGPQALTRTAGLVLLAPYLPTLFARLDLVVRAAFTGPVAIEQAADVLHHLAHGGPAAARPDDRPLERLLCGLGPEVPLRPPLPLDARAAAVADDLARAVIARWSALGATSVEGLREAFLRREGLLSPVEAGTRLDVASKPYDMLLDRLPWSIALVKLSWMPAPLHVHWRK
jgi:hypothetical protein